MFNMDTFTFAPCSQGTPDSISSLEFLPLYFQPLPAESLYLSSTLIFRIPNPLVKQQQLDVQCSSFIIKEHVLLSSVQTDTRHLMCSCSQEICKDFCISDGPLLCCLKCRDERKLGDCRQVGMLVAKVLCLPFQANDAKSESAQVSSVWA